MAFPVFNLPFLWKKSIFMDHVFVRFRKVSLSLTFLFAFYSLVKPDKSV